MKSQDTITTVITFLLVLPWLARGLASGTAIWQALTNGQKRRRSNDENRNITFTAMLLALGFLAISPLAQAIVPAPDRGYPGGNTADGQAALLSLTTGSYNTAVGLVSLLSNTAGHFNTAIGAA
jgi:hypothetical protein